MDWRTWVYETLKADDAIRELVGDRIYSTLGEDQPPDEDSALGRPFILIRYGGAVRSNVRGGGMNSVTLWVHDDPGSYTGIDAILKAARLALVGQVGAPGAIGCEWSDDSPDLADDGRGTLVRTSTFILASRSAG